MNHEENGYHDISETSQKVANLTAQRDAFQRAAMIAESNELLLYRRLMTYLDAEMAEKDQMSKEIQRLRGNSQGSQPEDSEVSDFGTVPEYEKPREITLPSERSGAEEGEK